MLMPRSRIFKATLLAAMMAASGASAEQSGAPSCPGPSGAGVSAHRLGESQPHLILDENFPDPFVARFGRDYHAFATGNQIGGGQMNVQLIRSRDLTRWTDPQEALPAANLPVWVDRSHPQVWAPEVMQVNGRFVLYFNARHSTLTRAEGPPEAKVVRQRHCIGAAVSRNPQGPFVGVGEPLVCSEFAEGAIDANVFREVGGLYLYFKDDGNCCGRGSAIYVQGLSSDGLAALGPPHRLVANNDSPGEEDDWEWMVVEAPTMVKRKDAYYLFYSGNFFGNKNYSVAYLKCASPRGPCADPGENPILWSHKVTALIGPGHQSVFEEGGRSYIFFHGWNMDPDGKEQPGVHKRCLYVGRLHWGHESGSSELRPLIAGGEPPEVP